MSRIIRRQPSDLSTTSVDTPPPLPRRRTSSQAHFTEVQHPTDLFDVNSTPIDPRLSSEIEGLEGTILKSFDAQIDSVQLKMKEISDLVERQSVVFKENVLEFTSELEHSVDKTLTLLEDVEVLQESMKFIADMHVKLAIIKDNITTIEATL